MRLDLRSVRTGTARLGRVAAGLVDGLHVSHMVPEYRHRLTDEEVAALVHWTPDILRSASEQQRCLLWACYPAAIDRFESDLAQQPTESCS